MKYCINIDWFEVFTYEPTDCYGAEWYESLGFKVARREYGTRVYKEMFTLIANGHPWLEVRRNPASKKSEGGILPDRACSLRLVNRACYDWFPLNDLYEFLRDLGFSYKSKGGRTSLCSVTRADICVDFPDGTFMVGEQKITCDEFIRRYLSGEWWKIGASKMQTFGEEYSDGMHYHAIKWGSPTSMVSTKIYDKTKEMAQVKIKPWIIESWVKAGVLQDENDMTPVWRMEFSIAAGADQWVCERPDAAQPDKYIQQYDLEAWLDTSNWARFLRGLISHYVVMADREEGKNKYRCRRWSPLVLPADAAFRPIHLKPIKQTSGRMEKILVNRLQKIRESAQLPSRFNNVLDATIYALGLLYGNRQLSHDPKQDEEVLRRLCQEYGDEQITMVFQTIEADTSLSRDDREAASRVYALYCQKFRGLLETSWQELPYSITAVQFTKRNKYTAEQKMVYRKLLQEIERRNDPMADLFDIPDAMDGWRDPRAWVKSGG